MSEVHVPDIESPCEPLCWAQDPVTLVRCDRRRHGPDVLHTWAMAAELERLRKVVADHNRHEHKWYEYDGSYYCYGCKTFMPDAEALTAFQAQERPR